jgi:hypothetical protein
MKEYFLKKAEENLPDLIKTRIFLDIEKKAFKQWRFFCIGSRKSLRRIFFV